MIYTGLKYQGETLLDYQCTFFLNEGHEGKTGLFQGWVSMGGMGIRKGRIW
jgi:hypothetical protein